MLAVLFAASPAEAQDRRFGEEFRVVYPAKLKVYESTFNELADKIEPVPFSGDYKFKVCSIPNPLGGCAQWLTICDSGWTAEVTQLDFHITPAALRITGLVKAKWCNLDINAELETTANVNYNASQRAILVAVEPTDIQPSFDILGYSVRVPMHVNVAPALTLPPIPVITAFFYFETARGGPQSLRLSPSGIVLTKRDGYVELQVTNVILW